MSGNKLRRILGWDEIEWCVEELAAILPDDGFDLLLVITRGGMVPAGLISERIGLRNIVVAAVQFHSQHGSSLEEPVFWQFPGEDILRERSVLIVDDVWDSGQTAVTVRSRVAEVARSAAVAVLHYKPGSSRYGDRETPDYYAEMTDDWIIYPWDQDDKDNP